MSSPDLKGDVIAVFTEYRNLIVGLLGAAIALLLLFALLGGRVLGGLLFLGYALVWLTVVGFVLWLFYRLVVAVERIAGAQERMASAQFQRELEATAAGEESEDGASREGSVGDEAADEEA